MKVNIFEKGFVEYIDHMGSDLTIVNSARVSFGKHTTELRARDQKLINYLWEHKHTSTFRHCYITFRVKAPIFVLRQWFKHRIGSEFNEQSLRYVEFNGDYYKPNVYRQQSKSNKQGSFGNIEEQDKADQLYQLSCDYAIRDYYRLIEMGVCREQARGILPMSMYTSVYWTASLQAILHFLKLREDSHAQFEIQEYAKGIRKITEQYFPVALGLGVNND